MDVPVIVVLEVEHVITPPVAAASGATKSPFTVAVAVCVQLLVPVTVKMYVPGVLTEGFWTFEVKLFGPVQAYVTPVVVELPLITIFCVPQLTVPPVADAVGGKVLPVTVAVAEEVQPFTGLVTTTVYVPAVSAIGF